MPVSLEARAISTQSLRRKFLPEVISSHAPPDTKPNCPAYVTELAFPGVSGPDRSSIAGKLIRANQTITRAHQSIGQTPRSEFIMPLVDSRLRKEGVFKDRRLY